MVDLGEAERMANPLFNMLMQQGQPVPTSNTVQPSMSGGIQFANPIQKMQYIMQAMQNPAAFVKQHIPDIPDSISGNPGKILQYLQETRGISNAQIQSIAQQIPPGMR